MEKKKAASISLILFFIIALSRVVTNSLTESEHTRNLLYWVHSFLMLIPFLLYYFLVKKKGKPVIKLFAVLEIIFAAISYACFMVSMTIIVFSIEDKLIMGWKYLPVLGIAAGCFCAMAVMALISHRVGKVEEIINKIQQEKAKTE